jgi:hypothetical protein
LVPSGLDVYLMGLQGDMPGLVTQIAILGFVIWSFFEPVVASWVFIALFVFALEGWLLILSIGLRSRISAQTPPLNFTDIEAELVSRHPVYFRYPEASRMFSAIVATVGMASWILIPWLAYQGQWIQAAILLLNFFVGGPLSHKLSPLNGLVMLAKRGDPKAQGLLHAHGPAWEKIFEVSRAYGSKQQ